MNGNKNLWIALALSLLLIAGSITFTVLKATSIASRTCVNQTKLAKIERRFINRQENQTQVFLSRGGSFGLPKGELQVLIDQSKASQQQFVSDLNELAQESCQ